MKDILFLSATEASQEIRSGRLAAVDLAGACIDRVRAYDGFLQAWEYFDSELAMIQALELDRRVKDGGAGGTLFGIPLGVKDVFNTRDMPTEMGSSIFSGYTPGNDARVVFGLRRAGAVILGKTVTAEFGVEFLDKTVNPHNPGYSPGTSSSGSAAAVSAAMVPLALGTQTAGSIIRPASYCGVYGFKPSFGLCPRTGILKTTDTLDHVGFFTRHVEDIRLLFDAIRVRGRDYPIAEEKLGNPDLQVVKGRPWRVGVIAQSSLAVLENSADYALQGLVDFVAMLNRLGIEVHEIEAPPKLNLAHSVHGTIYDATLAYYFREEAERSHLMSDSLREMISRGGRVTRAEYSAALEKQLELARVVDDMFTNLDVIITLSTAGVAPTLGKPDTPDSCLIWTLAGVPVASLPFGSGPQGMPFGIQVFSGKYADYRLISFLEFLNKNGVVATASIPEKML
jgi:Asp-tRNA(Asn)/Glu-tRNA(Gln) amidotransferase A subunit family amidase